MKKRLTGYSLILCAIMILVGCASRQQQAFKAVAGETHAAVTPVARPTVQWWMPRQNANAERLYLIPADVTIPMLRFYALHEDATRKLSVASAIPAGAITAVLNDLADAADKATAAIEIALGIAKAAPKKTTEKPKEPAEPKLGA